MENKRSVPLCVFHLTISSPFSSRLMNETNHRIFKSKSFPLHLVILRRLIRFASRSFGSRNFVSFLFISSFLRDLFFPLHFFTQISILKILYSAYKGKFVIQVSFLKLERENLKQLISGYFS